jgi:hypothetical protein
MNKDKSGFLITNEDFKEWSSDAPIEWIVQDDLSSLGDVSITAQGHSPKGRGWKQWLIRILFGALVSAAIVIFASFISGCKSPYPPCTTVGNYRCNGQTVEACDGRNWNPVSDCKTMYYMGDELAEIFFCEEISETRADCMPASDGGI